MAIRFHYDGLTVEVDPDWSIEWYKSKLDSYIASDGVEGQKWAWFWVDSKTETVFHFRIAGDVGYAFTQVGPANPNAIDDLRTVN